MHVGRAAGRKLRRQLHCTVRALSHEVRTAVRAERHLGGQLRLGSTSTAGGLFGLPGLHTPRDFMHLARGAEGACKRLVGEMEESPPSARSLHLMDELSEQLCRVMDAAELCRNVHPDLAWRASSTDVYAFLAGYIQELNSNQSLYSSLVGVLETPSVWETLSEEERIMGRMLKSDMERSGVHLPPVQHARFAALQAELVELSSTFMENTASQAAYNSIELPLAALRRAPAAAQQGITGYSPSTPDAVLLRCDKHASSAFLKSSGDQELRRQVYTAHNSSVGANLDVLDRILECRGELAQLMGFASYAEYPHTTLHLTSTRPR